MSRRCNKCLQTDGTIRMWGAVLWCRQCALGAGALGRRAILQHDYGADPSSLTPDVLKAIAEGPIMDSNALYLPAGRLSMEQYREREARILRGEAA